MTVPDIELAPLAPETVRRLRELNDRFTDVAAAERANYQIYLSELCEAIGVEKPRPAAAGTAGRVAEHTAYQFEFPVQTTTRDGTVSTNFIDLYKAGCFALEAKHSAEGASTTKLLTKAWGQVANYARDLAERPPYIMVLDVGRTLIIWDRWAGTYGGFHLGTRIDLRTLADHPEQVALLRDIWNDPARRDPRRHAQAITEEIAGLLGQLSRTMEERGEDPERVARFLIRCVFSMFAEDVKLLPNKAFTRLLDAVLDEPAERFVEAAEDLWKAMDAGTRFGYDRILRFNGHFFASAEALPLQKAELQLLRRASAADWSAVEPSIFGTLLVRALTPEERHRLGAEYTPRAFIERLVRPTVEEPVRERWTAVQAEVMQLRERGRAVDVKAAEARLLEFHAWLRGLRILDPACGSGNFLYVTMHALKRVEVEVFRLLSEVQGGQISTRMDEIDPGQFFGIEVKAWAREIAELTLWIGFHQFWKQQHGDVQPMEPLLRDTGTIECRDAVLAWDEIIHRPEKDRPDPTPRIVHPVTGQLVPDPDRKLPYYEYVGARQAEWPEADFIVGNPPYLGDKRQREAFGDGYVDALRAAYAAFPDGIDLVMYWWGKAASHVARGAAFRAGLITTNTITQKQNRALSVDSIAAGARIVWAVADHPWIDLADGAAVRVAMTVLGRDMEGAVEVVVDSSANEIRRRIVREFNSDLSSSADVAGAVRLKLESNRDIAHQGFSLQARGFVLAAAEAQALFAQDGSHEGVIREYRNGRDIAAGSREAFVIDFGLRSEEEAREFPVLFDIVRTRVKPERDTNGRAAYRKYWWRFGEARVGLRGATRDLARSICTVYVAKHRFFVFLPTRVALDDTLVCVASDAAWHLGVLSSLPHVLWSAVAGGTLEDRPRYNKSLCFDPFPFPQTGAAVRERVELLAERLDAHRKSAIARDERVTMTGMYNVVAKLRTGDALTPKERTIHEIAACGVLRDIHDELDALVAAAYGWPWPMPDEEILERLVALHDERVAEEQRGIIRWLRPEFQAPGQGAELQAEELALPASVPVAAAVTEAAPEPWPGGAIEQIGALKRLVQLAPLTVDEATARFSGAKREIVARHLETLAILGEVRETENGCFAGLDRPA
jgi:hypothetical protein